MDKGYRKDFDFNDASKVYIMAIIVPLIVSFILSMIIGIVAFFKASQVDIKVNETNIQWTYNNSTWENVDIYQRTNLGKQVKEDIVVKFKIEDDYLYWSNIENENWTKLVTVQNLRISIVTANLTSNIFVYSLLLLISQGTFLVIAFLYSKHNKIEIYSATKINNKVGILKIVVLSLIAVASLYLLLPFINFCDALIKSLGYNNSGELPFAINTWWKYIIALLVMGFLPAVCEETVFRGVVFNGVKNKYGVKIAVVVSALCFCIMHMSLQQMFYPLILGVVLALVVHFSNSLRASIFVHFLNNAIVITSTFIASFGVQEEAQTILISWKNALTAFIWLVVAGVVIVALLILLRYINKKQNKTIEIQPEANTKNQDVFEEKLEDEIFENKTQISDKLGKEKEANTQNEIQQNLEFTQKLNDKNEIVMFIVFVAISVVLYVVENIMYF